MVLGSLLVRLLVRAAGLATAPGPDLAALRRPLAYVFEPLAWAYLQDRDLVVVVWVLVQGLLLALLWGLFGGAILRLAAVDLSGDRREEGREALAFARRHWRSFVGARLALWGGVVLPLALAAAFAWLARLPQPFGGVLLALAVAGAVAAALVAVFVLSVVWTGGALVGPTIAGEDADAFDAVARAVGFTASGLPRLVGARLAFFSGVLLGSGWRLLRTLLVALLAWACVRAGAGEAGLDRALAILGASGPPADAARLGIGWTDYAVAVVIALGAGTLAILWVADLASRVLCARTATFLWMRQAVDGTPPTVLRTASRAPGHRDAEEAGFVEVARVE